MVIFARRLVEHLGGQVMDETGLRKAAEAAQSFDGLLGALQQKPVWAAWSSDAACIADRESDLGSVGRVVEQVCLRTWFNCSNIPPSCSGDWQKADYALSVYYNQRRAEPMKTCYFGGAAVIASPSTYRKLDNGCVVTTDPNTTPVTDEGYQAITRQGNFVKTARFFSRIVEELLHARVLDEAQLAALADSPPANMHNLLRIVRGAAWVCGGSSGRNCSGVSRPPAVPRHVSGKLWWWKWAFAGVGGFLLLVITCTAMYVAVRDHFMQIEKRSPHHAPRDTNPRERSSDVVDV